MCSFLRICLLGVFFNLSACALSIGGRVKKDEVMKVRKVAIIAYTFDYHMPVGESLLSGVMGREKNAGPTGLSGKRENRIVERPVSAQAIYYFQKALGGGFPWKVVSVDQAKNNALLQEYFNKNVKVGMFPLEQGHERYGLNGVEQNHYIYNIKKTGQLKEVARQMGVDAFVFVRMQTHIEFSMLGLGDTNYTTHVFMELYNPNSDESIMNLDASGDPATQNDFKSADPTFEGDKVQQLTFYGSRNATKKLMEKIKEKLK